ncbi:MAG: alpha/beta fold hydrolase [Hymenobacteraceae bacterium]|nr:alpha/beta fold hydrolase [Hymenobacteraceae bacterium]MDX5397028.1 alpha/beta fold hydrolase [Hymenobacteraceae bacterium]MDX5513102.1 alpha/beta fold hydrolase [Hymenobacteraceae bacterium]
MAETNTAADVIAAHRASGYFFEAGGVKSFALDMGEGPALLCLHGVPTSSFLYRKVLKRLQEQGFRGVSFDFPGLGLAGRPEDFDYSFKGLTKFSLKAVEALKLDKFHLVVHDIGGPIGFALAAQLKDRISSITILNTWIDVVNFSKPLPMQPFSVPLVDKLELALITHKTWELAFSNVAVSDTSGISKAEMDAYVDLLKREDDGAAFLKIMKGFDHSEEFRDLCYKAVQQVPYPVQAIWGADDPGLTLERYGREIQEVAGLKEVQQLSAKHLLQEDQWQEIADRIVRQAKQV